MTEKKRGHSRHLLYTIGLSFFSISLWAQQIVRGEIRDADSQRPIPFAAVSVLNTSPPIGGMADADGYFVLSGVPLGKRSFVFSLMGYEQKILMNIPVRSGKEVVLRVELQESANELNEVTITAGEGARTVNSMASVSARSLNMEESNRYAASFGDPARQVLNFAGVNSGGGGLSNAIVVRGNSPNSTLWRLEGVEIPDPNHFSTYPGSDGAVSMLSSNALASSDFFTSAYPAEYGNATGGVFDLRTRTGNAYKRETTLDLGFLGLGLLTEGPLFKKGGASYLLNYRYSTLAVLESIGLDLAGGTTSYQDLNFKVHIPTEKLGTFSLFGLYGNNWFRNEDRTYISSSNHVAGIKQSLIVGERSYVQNTLAFTRLQTDVYRAWDDILKVHREQSKDRSDALRLSSVLNTKFSKSFTLKSGFIASLLNENVLNADSSINMERSGQVFQLYIQGKYRMTRRLTSVFGLHYHLYGFTNARMVEPRLAFTYDLNEKHQISLGAGLHSRAMRLSIYTLTDDRTGRPYSNLKMTQSGQIVLGHQWDLSSSIALKTEVYYQRLSDLLVDTGSAFSVGNTLSVLETLEGEDISLSNDGSGRNYGLEFTLNQNLNKGFYWLSTLSLFQSEYKVADSEWYSSRFNQNYVFNFLMGKEFNVDRQKNNVLGINLRFNLMGGQRYSTINIPASLAEWREIYIPPFTEQVPDYWRIDFGVTFQWNKERTSSRISLDIQNLTNRKNELTRRVYYDSWTGGLGTERTFGNGLIPSFRYTFSF
jgi:hypothetical protein